MPELTFRLRWPDQTETVTYSPSTIVATYFEVGRAYGVAAFAALARRALQAASDRVKETYGHPCARAAASLAIIEQQAARFASELGATVTILGFGE